MPLKTFLVNNLVFISYASVDISTHSGLQFKR